MVLLPGEHAGNAGGTQQVSAPREWGQPGTVSAAWYQKMGDALPTPWQQSGGMPRGKYGP